MAAHDRLDGLTRLVSVVEGNGADKMVKDVGLDDAVQKMATHEAKLAVNGSCGPTGKIPRLWSVVWKGWVGVLEKGDRD